MAQRWMHSRASSEEPDPWGEWLDGDAWELTAGVDFTCTPASLRTLARTQ